MVTEAPSKPKLVRFEMNPSLLAELLHFPPEIAVVGVTWLGHKRCFEFFISGPDFEPVGEGETIPKLYPTMQRDVLSKEPVWLWQGHHGEGDT